MVVVFFEFDSLMIQRWFIDMLPSLYKNSADQLIVAQASAQSAIQAVQWFKDQVRSCSGLSDLFAAKNWESQSFWYNLLVSFLVYIFW